MAYTLEDFLSGKARKDYLEIREPNIFAAEAILPFDLQEELEFDYIKSADNKPITAEVVPFGGAAPIASRDGLGKVIGQLLAIKLKKSLEGRLLILAKKYGGQEPAVKRLFNDAQEMLNAVEVRIERMRVEALTTGKISINENGVKYTLDYGVPAANEKTVSVSWSDTANADIYQDIREWMDSLPWTPRRAMLNYKTWTYVRDNAKLKKMIYGDDKSTTPLSLNAVNTFFREMGMPIFAIYEAKYRTLGALVETQIWPDNIVSFFPEGPIGTLPIGPTEEEALGKNVIRDPRTGIYLVNYETEEPVAFWTKASATAAPSLPGANFLGIMTVVAS